MHIATSLAYLDTHYYAGIKKYQWVTLPMALHGVVAKKDGTVINVNIGDKEDDPVFVITDLLVHLASQQLDKKASVVIEGEKLQQLLTLSKLAIPAFGYRNMDNAPCLPEWVLRTQGRERLAHCLG